MENLSYYIFKKILTVKNEFTSVIFVEFTEIIWNKRDSNGFFVSILIKDTGWHLKVIGILHNE